MVELKENITNMKAIIKMKEEEDLNRIKMTEAQLHETAKLKQTISELQDKIGSLE